MNFNYGSITGRTLLKTKLDTPGCVYMEGGLQ